MNLIAHVPFDNKTARGGGADRATSEVTVGCAAGEWNVDLDAARRELPA